LTDALQNGRSRGTRGEFSVPGEPELSAALFGPGTRAPGFGRRGTSKKTLDFFWGRSAIYHGVRAIGITPGDVVLVPAYHCATLVEPVIRCGADVEFYSIRRDCSVDLDDVRSRVGGRTRALLVVHYFGFPQAIGELREFCRKHHLFLIEDCAHVLVGRTEGGALGEFGDISVFSWRKFLPVHDGGRLVINNSGLDVEVPWSRPSALLQLKIALSLLQKLGGDTVSETLSGLARMLQWPARIVGRHHRSKSADGGVEVHSFDFEPAAANLGMSGLSKFIARRVDFGEIVRTRRSNYERLASRLASVPGVRPFFDEVPDGVSPWVFPVIAPGIPQFHMKLRAEGIPAFAWDGVIHPALPQDEFEDAVYLYHNLVLLPLHQTIRAEDIDRIHLAVARVVEAAAGKTRYA
jgi:dTDP-4-amino-4,6-dideoxygalactose transaminase